MYRNIHKRWTAVAAAGFLLLTGGLAPAQAAPCTDGVDCLCDRLDGAPGVVYCEDFENPGFDQAGALDSSHAWRQKYGPTVDGNCEGESSSCAFNIVTPGRCQATGEDDCVHDGNQTLGIKYRPGEDGGGIGATTFNNTPIKTIGVTVAMRYSPTFYEPDFTTASPGCGENHTGVKTDFLRNTADDGSNKSLPFGGTETAYNSCSVPSCTPALPCGDIVPSSHPFGAIYKMDSCDNPATCDTQLPTVTEGWACNQGFHKNFYPNPDLYNYGVTPGIGNGQWMCVQFQWQDYGSTHSSVRYWVNGQKIIDASNVDSSRARGSTRNGWNEFVYDGFYNGCYNGPNLAYRYEDNVVITSASEPVPCSEIGFDFSGGGGSSEPGPLAVNYFTASPTSGDAPLGVEFAARAVGGSGPYTYELDCEDGSGTDFTLQGSTGVQFTGCPAYGAGQTTARLRVTDQALDSVSQTVVVSAATPGEPVSFSDDFSGGLANWETEFGGYTTSGGLLDPGNDAADTGDRILWTATTGTINQYALVEFATLNDPAGGVCTGLFLRADGLRNERYAVDYCDFGSTHLKWVWDGGSGNTTDIQKQSYPALGSGNWLGAEVRGTGSNTVLDIWVFDADPGPRSGWGAPTLRFENDPARPVDRGKQIGIDLYRQNVSDEVVFDNFRGGDAGTDAPPPATVEPLGEPGQPTPDI